MDYSRRVLSLWRRWRYFSCFVSFLLFRNLRTPAKMFLIVFTFWAAVWAIYFWNSINPSDFVSVVGLAGSALVILIIFAFIKFILPTIVASVPSRIVRTS